MLTVVLIVCIALLLCGMYLYDKDYDNIGIVVGAVGGIIGCFVVIALLFGIITCMNAKGVDKKIEMYTEENTIIQEDINLMVGEYMNWEAETYEKFKGADPTIVINLYPELKSNELVLKQMDVYLNNKKQIKCLKEKKIDADIWRWWVYFG